MPRQFYQKRLGEEWDEEAGVDPNAQIVPPPFEKDAKLIPLRIVTVDCQMDHFFLVLRGWSAEGSSRLIWCERVAMLVGMSSVAENQAAIENLPSEQRREVAE